MPTEADFLLSLQANPEDRNLRRIFADWLEEQGDSRAELVRLTDTLTQSIDVPNRPQHETRLRELVAAGVRPIGPFFTNSIGMQFAWIPPGTFLMGSPESEKEREDIETLHRVTLTRGFYLGIHPVTQEQWHAGMGNNPSHFQGETNLPVERVSWEDCQELIQSLRQMDGKPYRLPTEAEWEYACRAGTTTPFFFGSTLSTDLANYNGQYVYDGGKKGVDREKTTPVDLFLANEFGLYDMHGNIWEWCQDWYGDYPSKDVLNPLGPDTGEYRVLRGGSWLTYPRYCRSAFRGYSGPGTRDYSLGARLALGLD